MNILSRWRRLLLPLPRTGPAAPPDVVGAGEGRTALGPRAQRLRTLPKAIDFSRESEPSFSLRAGTVRAPEAAERARSPSAAGAMGGGDSKNSGASCRSLLLRTGTVRAPLPNVPGRGLFGSLGLLLLLVLATGCERSDIRVYRIPKEDPWKLPAGWEVREPGAMRVARFAVPGQGGRETDVSLIPLKGMPGSRADVLNIWRQQLRLEPLDEDALAKMAEKVSVNSAGGELFDMAGAEAGTDGHSRIRTLLATVKNDNTTWFIKMTGDDEQVQREKPVFISFLKTLKLDAMPAPAPARPHAESAANESSRAPAAVRPEWSVPPGWQEQPPSPMLLARFQVAGGDGAKADVNITVLDGDGGGMSENVNRWRTQLGLARMPEEELHKLLTPLDVPGGKAILVDMSGTDVKTRQPARLIGAIVPREDRTWFYKLMGDEQLAEREKAAFIKFFQNAKYPNG